jgi:predicted Fe-Mo cluster-binding NifX family protein
MRSVLEGGGVDVVPWLTGTVDQAVDAFRSDTLPDLTMPGCGECQLPGPAI